VDRTADEKEKIKTSAKALINKTWRPAFFMIDKDGAERKACATGGLLM
jgi:hypothetical protein